MFELRDTKGSYPIKQMTINNNKQNVENMSISFSADGFGETLSIYKEKELEFSISYDPCEDDPLIIYYHEDVINDENLKNSQKLIVIEDYVNNEKIRIYY